MAAASVRRGTPVGEVARNRARRTSREVMRPTTARATDPKRSLSASRTFPATPPALAPHRHRHLAESFGSDADRYDRARPRYPEALVSRLAAAGPDVLDVGCGTGIAARQFAAAGCTVLGVEPDARMARTAQRLGTEVDIAAFEAWEPVGREFDAVVAGQAWHW
ncbi:class I SAM-dependent methyltransferase, partial [Streptomyces sp. NPDC005904]|uniref:class I SAM-dependent methyltransferase n=1 Tax=Streptomyces sp. NPDC005904 TaxID=3154570 RepID=UPI0034080496